MSSPTNSPNSTFPSQAILGFFDQQKEEAYRNRPKPTPGVERIATLRAELSNPASFIEKSPTGMAYFSRNFIDKADQAFKSLWDEHGNVFLGKSPFDQEHVAQMGDLFHIFGQAKLTLAKDKGSIGGVASFIAAKDYLRASLTHQWHAMGLIEKELCFSVDARFVPSKLESIRWPKFAELESKFQKTNGSLVFDPKVITEALTHKIANNEVTEEQVLKMVDTLIALGDCQRRLNVYTRSYEKEEMLQVLNEKIFLMPNVTTKIRQWECKKMEEDSCSNITDDLKAQAYKRYEASLPKEPTTDEMLAELKEYKKELGFAFCKIAGVTVMAGATVLNGGFMGKADAIFHKLWKEYKATGPYVQEHVAKMGELFKTFGQAKFLQADLSMADSDKTFLNGKISRGLLNEHMHAIDYLHVSLTYQWRSMGLIGNNSVVPFPDSYPPSSLERMRVKSFEMLEKEFKRYAPTPQFPEGELVFDPQKLTAALAEKFAKKEVTEEQLLDIVDTLMSLDACLKRLDVLQAREGMRGVRVQGYAEEQEVMQMIPMMKEKIPAAEKLVAKISEWETPQQA